MLNVTFYNFTGEPDTIQKTIGTGTQLTGTARNEIDQVNPTLLFEGVPLGSNYAYIDSFGSYYYCDPPSPVRSGIYSVSMHRDPLTTFASQILGLPAIAARTQTEGDRYSSYLPDNEQRCYTYKTICTRLIHTFAYGSNYILITAG